MKNKSVEQINAIDKEKDYSSYYEICDDGSIHFLKTWTNGKDFQDLEKELIEEYGDDVVINLESGEIKPAEKKEK